jgi:copper homeostasis protein (lipoprotein)
MSFMKRSTFFISILTFLSLVSCRSPFTHLTEKKTQNFYDYTGNWQSDPNDKQKFQLLISDDGSFERSLEVLGKETKTIKEKGRVLLTRNGKYLALKSAQQVYLGYYKLEKGSLIKVDAKGKQVSPHLELIRMKSNDGISNKYWKLLSIRGKAIGKSNSREAHVKFIDEESKVSGHTGCNSFGGSWKLKDQSELQISGLFQTEMYCEEVTWETEFLEALSQADGFILKEDKLELMKDGVVLLFFGAVYF